MTAERNPFARTRDDHARESAEDYVELIFNLGKDDEVRSGASPCERAPRVRTADLARALEVAQPTVTKTLERLQREGLVCIHPREFIHLTGQGEELARESRARHADVVAFLVSIGVPKAQAELDAEGIEHHVSTTTLQAMRRMIQGK